MITVSSSDFVRRFGVWQDRALETPVYIRHHGRARFVLTSIEFMEKLIAARETQPSESRSVESLLELIDSIVVVTDDRLCVTAMSGPARHHFARTDWHGRTLVDLLPEQLRPVMMRSVTHVRATGLVDSFQLRIGETARRTLDVTIRPFDGGVCIIGHDRMATEARLEVGALSDAVRQTLTALGTIAIVRLNIRGFITRATESFDTMSGLDRDAYGSVRMPSLFDVGSRIAIGEALEQTIDRVAPHVVSARLLVNRAEPIDVRVAFSAEMLRTSVDAIIATIVRET